MDSINKDKTEFTNKKQINIKNYLTSLPEN